MSHPQPNTSLHTQADRWKHGAGVLIGLIGGIGSGKSRVAGLLAARGAVVIDADEVGHDVLNQPEIRRVVVERFGPRVSGAAGATEGSIDRRALGAIVFADAGALRDLETLLHPPMERRFRELIAQASQEHLAPAIILDAAILLEKAWDRFCDLVVFVEAPWALRLERVTSSRGWSPDTLRAREAAQWPVETKRSRADAVIRNDEGVEVLERSVDEFLETLTRPETALQACREVPRMRARAVLAPALHADRR